MKRNTSSETGNNVSESEDTPGIEAENYGDKPNYELDGEAQSCLFLPANSKASLDARNTQNEKSVENATKCLDNEQKLYIDDDTRCGIAFFKPEWLQKYATPRSFLVLYSIIGVLQGSYYSYFTGCMTTLEKRFAFPSRISGYIMAAADISPLFLSIPIGYFGGRSHQPRIIAFGMFITVVSCFVTALPYFLHGKVQISATNNATGPDVCDGLTKVESCDVDDRPPTLSVVIILLFGSLAEGFGGMTYYAVGLTYMDDNSKKRNTPYYFAIAFALRLFGPTLGFLMSSAFLKLHENPFEDPGYGPDDPRWIGGWWMGFIVQGFLLLFFTIPLTFFPRRLPCRKPRSNSIHGDDEKLVEKFKGMFLALKRLVVNPLYIFLTINAVLSVLGSFGHYIMLPKYMENQFRLTASDASLYSGPPGLVSIQIATIFGGFVIWKYRPSAKLLTGGMVLTEIVQAIGYLILMIPKCENVALYNSGLTLDGLDLQNQCNANCLCTTAAFTPVCGPDGVTTYFSPCYAGCTESETVNETMLLTNCTCVDYYEKDYSESFVTAHSLKKGFCVEENCWSQALAYIVILPVFHGITNILRVTNTMVLMRSISPGDKAVALGAYLPTICLFAFIPYPILFGALIDSACLVWEKSCGQTGNCWFYDMEKFNYMLHGVSASFTMLSALSLLAVFFLRSRLHDLYEDDDLDKIASAKIAKIEMTDSKVPLSGH